MKLRILSLLAAAVILLSSVMAPSPARAQEEKSSVAGLQFVGQTPVVTEGASFDLQTRVITQMSIDQLDLAISIYGPIPNRSSFEQALDNHFSGSPVVFERRSLGEVADSSLVARLSLPVRDSKQRRYFLRDNGVYPVKVEIRETGGSVALDSFVTFLVNEPQTAPPSPLLVSTILPLQSPVSSDSSSIRDIPDGGRAVRTVIDAVDAHADVPVTLNPQPETLDRLGASTEQQVVELRDQAISTARTHGSIVGTWAPVPSFVFDAGFESVRDEQFKRSTDAVGGPSAVDRTTWPVTDALDSGAFNYIADHGTKRMVVAQNALANSTLDTTLARPFQVSPSDKSKLSMPAVQADAGLAARFHSTPQPALAAQHLLADLSVIWHDRPAQARGVLVMPDLTWTPSREFLDAFMTGVTSSPILHPATLDDLFALPPEGGQRSPMNLKMNVPPRASTDWAKRLHEQTSRLTAFESMAGSDSKVVDAFHERLLYSVSSAFDPARRNELTDRFAQALDVELGRIRLPKERTLRLTARQGVIPVSVQSDTGYPIKVKLTLASDKLEFPDGNSRVIDITRPTSTETFAIKARTSGAFPVQMKIESPDGEITLGKGRVVVESTAASGIGLGLSIGAGAFLVVWWMRSAVKTRRKKAGAPT